MSSKKARSEKAPCLITAWMDQSPKFEAISVNLGEQLMGGFGSTRWNWSSTKDTVEANPSLDIDGLNRAGCLRPGYRGSWKWTRDGGRIASIQLRRDINTLVLSYRIPPQLDRGDLLAIASPFPAAAIPRT